MSNVRSAQSSSSNICIIPRESFMVSHSFYYPGKSRLSEMCMEHTKKMGEGNTNMQSYSSLKRMGKVN